LAFFISAGLTCAAPRQPFALIIMLPGQLPICNRPPTSTLPSAADLPTKAEDGGARNENYWCASVSQFPLPMCLI
ncbi:hypothetical protein EDB83DRAFT_2369169, partial [Lactarius deliciosus]